MPKSGIYTIYCKANGKYYIGRTNRFRARIAEHLFRLRGFRHSNQILQNTFNKYGEETFSFSLLLEENSSERLIKIEQCLIDGHIHDPDCMNLSKDSAGGGGLMTDEIRRKLSISCKNSFKVQTNIRRVNKILDERGRTRSPESIEKTAKALRGQSRPQWVREKLSKAFKNSEALHKSLAEIARRRSISVKANNCLTNEELLFESIKETSKYFGVAESTIKRYLIGKFPQPIPAEARNGRRYRTNQKMVGWSFTVVPLLLL